MLLYSKEHFSSKIVRIATGPLGSLSQGLSNFTVTLLLNPMEQRAETKTLRNSHMVWILLPRGPHWEQQCSISSYHSQRSQSMGDTGKTKPDDQPPKARSPPLIPHVRDSRHCRFIIYSLVLRVPYIYSMWHVCIHICSCVCMQMYSLVYKGIGRN